MITSFSAAASSDDLLNAHQEALISSECSSLYPCEVNSFRYDETRFVVVVQKYLISENGELLTEHERGEHQYMFTINGKLESESGLIQVKTEMPRITFIIEGVGKEKELSE